MTRKHLRNKLNELGSYRKLADYLGISYHSCIRNYIEHGTIPSNPEIQRKLGIKNYSKNYKRKRRALLDWRAFLKGWGSWNEYEKAIYHKEVAIPERGEIMRYMSFAFTTDAMYKRTKKVTRRLGWDFLKPGDVVMAVEKYRGIPRSEIEIIYPIRILSITKVRLHEITKDEVVLEGFPNMSVDAFIAFFCTHMKCDPDTMVNRIEFEDAGKEIYDQWYKKNRTLKPHREDGI